MEDFLAIYPRALSPEFCTDVIQRFEGDPRKAAGRVGDGVLRPDYKGTTEIDFGEIRQGWEDVITMAGRSLTFYLREFMSRFGEAFGSVDVHHEPFRIARYNPGQQFGWHVDNVGGSYSRVLTAIWYLNTVEKGGCTEFRWLKRNVQPVEGSLLVFPVAWPFYWRDAPPESGPKYILMTQLHQRRPQPAG